MVKVKKRVIIFLFLCLIVLAAITFQHKGKPVTAFNVLSYPFALLDSATAKARGTFSEVTNAVKENKQLKRELTQALLEKQKVSEIIQENRRLKELLSLKEHSTHPVTAARVISHGYDRFLSTLILDKGESSGIRKDMAVVSAKGLAGKIYSARNDYSELLLLKDPNSSAAVRLQDSRVEGVLSGTGHSSFLLKYIPFEQKVEKGEVVITSGLDGIFPPGLPVGVVGVIKKEEGTDFFQHIEVVPFQSEATLEEVIVLQGAWSPKSATRGSAKGE